MILTASDVEGLLHNDSAKSRVNVLDKVAIHYEDEKLTTRETEIAEQIFRLLMKDAEMFVCTALAERMKLNPNVPRDIMLHLANAHADIAMPVLQYSPVLSDADLVYIVEGSRELSKLQSIAQRDKVSNRVSGALIETHYPEVVTELLHNETATITGATMEQVMQDFQHEESVLTALASRAQLPAMVVDHLMQHASNQVTAALKKRFGKEAIKPVETSANQLQESTLMQLLARTPDIDDLRPLVHQLHSDGRLNAALIMTTLCRGYINFVRVAVAKLADIPLRNAIKLLSDKGDLGVHAIYVRSQMPQSMYQAVRVLLLISHELEEQGILPGSQAYANAAVEKLLAHSQQMEIENLPYIMALLRQ
jgi:uncharacterized protein (DUF2336 family)